VREKWKKRSEEKSRRHDLKAKKLRARESISKERRESEKKNKKNFAACRLAVELTVHTRERKIQGSEKKR
jgi:hypothetical protein